MLTIDIESMAIEMPAVAGHPNREAFRGVLTLVDVPSERAPAGSRGHRVVLMRRAAEAALPSLLGMALDYAPTLDRHDVRRKVGIITRADVVGNKVELGGYLFAKDFPEIVREIARSKRQPGKSLGMSYEVTNAQVADLRAKVWTLTRVIFTGAAILRRDRAAYPGSWIELE